MAACHDAGIEVLLDVVYNHTTEGNRNGPILSWRGFRRSHLLPPGEDGDYLDVSGCGNSIRRQPADQHPVDPGVNALLGP